jgi:NAD dependent epimerase/dehydratase family
MKEHGCYNLVFSSSCTVYGSPEFLPITEEHPTGKVTNVYGRTKFFVEEMLKDVSVAEKVNIVCTIKEFQAETSTCCSNGTSSCSDTSTLWVRTHQALLEKTPQSHSPTSCHTLRKLPSAPNLSSPSLAATTKLTMEQVLKIAPINLSILKLHS